MEGRAEREGGKEVIGWRERERRENKVKRRIKRRNEKKERM
jgi:hypothetical protein